MICKCTWARPCSTPNSSKAWAKQAQRNAALGSWEYRDGFHWSPEALSLLGRSADDAQGSLEQLLS